MEYAVTLENVSIDRFTDRTIKKMYEHIDAARTDVYLQNMAGQIVQGCPHKDYVCFGNKLLAAAKQLIPYIPDPKGIERIQDPWTTLIERRADCDDYAILLAVWGHGVGMDAALMTIKAETDPQTGKILDKWSHVLPVLRPAGSNIWYGADAIVPESDFGWEPPKQYPRKVWAR